MPVNVTDLKNLPVKIFQIELSRVNTLLNIDILNKITNKIGVAKDNYFVLPTDGNVSWLQPTKELQGYHAFLHILRRKLGCKNLMIINDTPTNEEKI